MFFSISSAHISQSGTFKDGFIDSTEVNVRLLIAQSANFLKLLHCTIMYYCMPMQIIYECINK